MFKFILSGRFLGTVFRLKMIIGQHFLLFVVTQRTTIKLHFFVFKLRKYR